MTARRVRLQEVERPRLVTVTELAYYLGLSPNALSAKQPTLREAGMPQPDPLLGLWDLVAIDAWLDLRRRSTAQARLYGRLGLDAPPDPAQADEDLDSRIASYGKN